MYRTEKMGSALSSNVATVSKVPSSNESTDQFQQKDNFMTDDDERPQKRHEKSLQTPIVMEDDESDESGVCTLQIEQIYDEIKMLKL